MAVWQRENDSDKAVKFILFLISPFFSFLYSLRTMKTRSSYVVFFMFAVFFGMAFSVPSGSTDTIGIDGADYREWFDSYKHVTVWEFIQGWDSFLTFDEGNKDYYFDTVAFYLTRITDNYHVMFMVFAIVFVYFLLRSFKFLTSLDAFDASLSTLILSYLFVFNQIFNINGVRFWTAAWIGIFVIFKTFHSNDRKYWLLAFVTPFFHGSFWVFIGVLLIAKLTRKYEKMWVVLFIISFFVSNIAIELLQSIQSSLPAFMSGMIDSYTDSEYVKLRNEIGSGFSWIPYTFNVFIRLYQSLIIYLFIKNSKLIRQNKQSESIYLFLLVWVTVFNFLAFVPSLGNRFIVFVWPMIAYIWMVNFKGVKYEKVLYAMPFIFAWNFYTMLGYYSMVLSLDFFVSSPFVLLYKYLIAY